MSSVNSIFKELKWWERLCVNIIKSGPIPKHIGIIMDGNRRYARKYKSGNLLDGYKNGYDKLLYAFNLFMAAGVEALTFFTFSIDNFNRSQNEIDEIFDLFRLIYPQILSDTEKYKRRGIRFKFVGNLKLMPKDIQKLMAQLMWISKDGKAFTINFAMPYTTRYDVVQGMKHLLSAVENKKILNEDINADLLSALLVMPSVDLIIRSSGETRLSDFLTWQSSAAILYFFNDLWPNSGLYQLIKAILYYQQCLFNKEFSTFKSETEMMGFNKDTLKILQKSITDENESYIQKLLK